MNPEADSPVPGPLARRVLFVAEIGAWALAVFVVICTAIAVGLVATGFQLLGAVIDDPARLPPDVVSAEVTLELDSVPFSGAVAFSAGMLFFGLIIFAGLMVLWALTLRRCRRGKLFTPGMALAYGVLAGAWIALSIVEAVSVGDISQAIAASVGADAPYLNFHEPSTESVVTWAIGPVLAVAALIFAAGARMWDDQRSLV